MSDISLCDCKELWIEIFNKNGSKYFLSSKGRMKNNKEKYIVYKTKDEYIKLNNNSYFFSRLIHRLLVRYFYQLNIEEYDRRWNEIDHINTIKNHNCLCNLKLCSKKENNNNKLTRQKNSEAQKGKIVSKETKEKMSKSKKGVQHPLYGKKRREEIKKKISNTLKDQPKNFKCYFCNSKLMAIQHFIKHHSNGKCLFK